MKNILKTFGTVAVCCALVMLYLTFTEIFFLASHNAWQDFGLGSVFSTLVNFDAKIFGALHMSILIVISLLTIRFLSIEPGSLGKLWKDAFKLPNKRLTYAAITIIALNLAFGIAFHIVFDRPYKGIGDQLGGLVYQVLWALFAGLAFFGIWQRLFLERKLPIAVLAVLMPLACWKAISIWGYVGHSFDKFTYFPQEASLVFLLRDILLFVSFWLAAVAFAKHKSLGFVFILLLLSNFKF